MLPSCGLDRDTELAENAVTRDECDQRGWRLCVNCRAEELADFVTDHFGRSNFAATIARRNQVRFFAVDLLHLNGGDLRGVPLVKRKERLKRILPSRSPHVLYVDYTRSSGGSYPPLLRA